MAEVIGRIVLALVSVAVVAALSIQLRAHDLLADVTSTAGQPRPSAAALEARIADAKRLEGLRPGSQPFLAAATLNFRLRRFDAAAAAATRAAQREPENFSAWVTLAVARGGAGDKAGQRAAYARAHRLNPLYPIPR